MPPGTLPPHHGEPRDHCNRAADRGWARRKLRTSHESAGLWTAHCSQPQPKQAAGKGGERRTSQEQAGTRGSWIGCSLNARAGTSSTTLRPGIDPSKRSRCAVRCHPVALSRSLPARHNFVNEGSVEPKLYTVYTAA